MDKTHKEWDFRDDCTEFILYISLHSWFPETVNFIFAQSFEPENIYIILGLELDGGAVERKHLYLKISEKYINTFINIFNFYSRLW